MPVPRCRKKWTPAPKREAGSRGAPAGLGGGGGRKRYGALAPIACGGGIRVSLPAPVDGRPGRFIQCFFPLPTVLARPAKCLLIKHMSEPQPAIAHPAATVVLLRESGNGCEVLLVRRNAQLAFHGGAWVFPGGRLDRADYADDAHDTIAAARCAAVREAREEAGLVLRPDALVLVSRWIT